MRYLLIVLFLIPFTATAEYFDYSSKWATSDNYRLQVKTHITNAIHLDLELENAFYNQKSNIRLETRRIGATYGIDLKPLTIYAGVIYNIQEPVLQTNQDFKWTEFTVSANYKVENYPLLIDIKYNIPTTKDTETLPVNMQRKEKGFSIGVGYELLNGLYIRAEKQAGGDYYIGFRKWID